MYAAARTWAVTYSPTALFGADFFLNFYTSTAPARALLPLHALYPRAPDIAAFHTALAPAVLYWTCFRINCVQAYASYYIARNSTSAEKAATRLCILLLTSCSFHLLPL